VKEARRTGRTIREIALDHDLLPPDELDKVLDITWMTKGGLGDDRR
jgi:aspartate ammonia-lyase